VHTEHRVPRRRRGQRNSTPANIIEAANQLALVAKDDVIAGLLHREDGPVLTIDEINEAIAAGWAGER